MEKIVEFIFDLLAQFGGGRGNIRNELARFGLAMVFWSILILLAWTKRRNHIPIRERWLLIGFYVAFLREFIMFSVYTTIIMGLISEDILHPYFPPLEHALSQGAIIVIAAAFIGYMLDNIRLSKKYLFAGLFVTVACYLATFVAWPKILQAAPHLHFGETWCDWLFRSTASILLLTALVLMLKVRGKNRNVLLLAFLFFFLDDFLMLFNLGTGETYKSYFGPLRHNLHIWAIPILGYVYYNEQLDERETAEATLRESEDRYRRLAENAPDMIFRMVLPDEKFEYNSPVCAKILGCTPEQFYADPSLFKRLIQSEYRDLFDTQWKLFLSENGTAVWEYPVEQPSGELRWVNQRNVLVRDERGNINFVEGILTDITDRKNAQNQQALLEEQLQQNKKMELMGRLAGGVAHDFNNLLGVILGYTDMLQQDLSPEHPSYPKLQEVINAGQRASELTVQLLAFARKQVLMPATFNPNDRVSDMLKMLRRLIGENIELVWTPGNNIWNVTADPSLLDQILINLVVNARDAISGVGEITIETKNASISEDFCVSSVDCVPGNYVTLSVTDSGCGMDKETLSHIFEPFYTTKGLGKGTGLGLSTVYGAVKQNGGFVNVYSEPGHGSTFRIYLPWSEYGLHPSPGKESSPSNLRGTETILLVEDEKSILDLSKMFLERLGYNVLATERPGEALKLAEEFSGVIHLLVTDVIMPEMNGLELANTLTLSRPEVKRLFMSGYTAEVLSSREILDTKVPFIQKPFYIRDLALKIRAVLDSTPSAAQ